ncbi:hypothetical protein [Zophobihabitans entericus]|uniref:Uncharacterized protein n=1 Tax=Zophobihabitans entericus TaxID=1635327 RepID=A0A6G9IBM9_9GAMM|nr:hypothetical protein [Zophobihabitans entericus]QIQ21237.1 hypothetical protein IPMB12_05795 [Zophobihabitans entericus]
MQNKNWKKALPGLGMGTLFLFGSSVVYAQLAKQPTLAITTDQFNNEQKLNLSIYNPKLTLTSAGVFSMPMGLYVYSNYPTKISSYALTIYRASDADNVQPLKVLRFNDVSPYEAVMWTGQIDTGTLSPNTQYKVILEVEGENGRRDRVAPVYFETLGVNNQAQESDFDVYTRDAEAGFRFSDLADKPYLSERVINGQTVQVVDLSKLSAMSEEEQQQFWNSAVIQVRPHEINNADFAKSEQPVTAQTTTRATNTNDALLRGQLRDSAEIPGFGINRVEQQGIVTSAQDRTIVVQMAGLEGKQDVMLNGERLMVDNRGRAMREVVLSPGEYDFNLSWLDENGERHTQQDSLVIEKSNDFFFVGMAEVTWAQNKVSGDGKMILEDADAHHYRGTGSWDGRVQFYLKGNMDEYRITAHLDTTETKLKDAFGRIGDRDPRRFTRELDPNAYYPIFGDDSTVENDVDTEGKFYVKLENGKNYALWGNYNTQMTGTAFSDFNRSLYGAKIYHESEATTKFGDTRSYAALFGATGDTRGSHNEFSSTGGSLYFLKHQRVTEGTLKLSVELRDPNTGRVKSIQTLTEGVDFEIDNFQGRILLTNPLPMTANSGTGGSIISGGSLLNGDNVWLVADYEYYSDGFDMEEQKVFGARAYGWVNDYIRLGGSYVHEDQATGESYQLQGVDLIVRPLQGTHTHVEYATSDASSNDIYVSSNGGLGFSKVSLGDNTKGAAWRIEQEADFNEYFESEVPLKFKGYYSMKQQGFSSFSTARDNDLEEWGAEVRYDFEQDKSGFLLSYTREEEKTLHLEKIARAQYFASLGESLKGAVELQDRRENSYNGAGETRESLAAVKLETELFEGRDKAYIIQQVTLDKRGDVSDNNKTTVGYQSQITDSLNIGAEVFGSNRGAGGGVSAAWDMNERASVYTKVMNDIDSNAGRGITTTVGTNVKATSQMDIYSERQFKSQNTQRSTSDVYGVKFKPTDSQYIDASYSTGQVNYRNSGSTTLTGNNDTKRDVYLLGYGFKNDWFQIRNKLEYRWERGNGETVKQWVSTNRAKTIVSENFSWLGQFDIAKTTGSNDVVNDFTEAAVGFAYRPMEINNLNLFGKVTYIRGVDPEDQLIANTGSSGTTSYYSSQYDQKSWVFALEGVYEFNQYWETAFKAAHREGYLRYKGESEWFSSGASLYAARVNFNYADFEYQVEYRTLRTSLADDHKDGIVTSIYRNLGDNAKIGIGYNFTEYNDDLTRLNYDAKGWFINVVGSF